MENGAFLRGEKLWLWGREVTFLRYQSLEYPGTGPGIAEAVVPMFEPNVNKWLNR